MQIRMIRIGFELFECKFEPFEWDSKNSNPNSNWILTIGTQIQVNRKWLEGFECIFEQFERDSNHSKPSLNHSNEIQSIRMEIWTIQMGV